ncbi:MAG: hypothetical protein ACTSYD_03190 [Candidatus Heimdallarchaeaceae archaeon]
MASFLKFISALFNKDVSRFKQMVIEQLESKHFIDLKKIPSKLSLQKRYEVLVKMIEKNELTGRFIPNTNYFLNIDNNLIERYRKNLKTRGYLALNDINKSLDLPPKILDRFMQQLEKGYLTNAYFYTELFLKRRITEILKDKTTYDIKLIAKSLKIEVSLVDHILQLLLKEGELYGIIQDETTYLSSDAFTEQLESLIKDLVGSGEELSFEDIADRLRVDKTEVDSYLVKYANEHPYDCTLYPLERKILFKK